MQGGRCTSPIRGGIFGTLQRIQNLRQHQRIGVFRNLRISTSRVYSRRYRPQGRVLRFHNGSEVLEWVEEWQSLLTLFVAMNEELQSHKSPYEDAELVAVQKCIDILSDVFRLCHAVLLNYVHMLQEHFVTAILSSPFRSLVSFGCDSLERKNGHQTVLFTHSTVGTGGSGGSMVRAYMRMLKLELSRNFLFDSC
jgi:hypothetical protein